MLAPTEENIFEPVSFLVSSLCETLRIFEQKASCQAEDPNTSSSFLLAASVVSKAVEVYQDMASSLCPLMSAQPISIHVKLRLLADMQTMKLQLLYMRRMCQLSENSFSSDTMRRVDATVDALQRYSRLCR